MYVTKFSAFLIFFASFWATASAQNIPVRFFSPTFTDRAVANIPESDAGTKLDFGFVKKETHPQEQNLSEIDLALDNKFISILGKADDGTKGHLNSGDSHGLKLAWSTLPADSNLWLTFGMQIQQYKFNDSNDKTLHNRSLSTQQVWIRAAYKINPYWISALTLSSGEQVFYRSTTTTDIKVEKAGVHSVTAGLRYNFFKSQAIVYGLKAEARVHLPMETDYYKSSMGTGYVGTVVAEHRLRQITVYGEAYYSNDRFPIKGITYDRQDTGVVFGIKFRLGSEQ